MKRPVGPRAVRKAIALIEGSKYSHERAIHEPEYEITGSVKFHRDAIAEYEYVLKVLRRIKDNL